MLGIISRRDWSQLVSELEDALDRAAVVESRRPEPRQGRRAARTHRPTTFDAALERELTQGPSLFRVGTICWTIFCLTKD